MQPLRILLVHPHPFVRTNLRWLLEREPGFQVIAEAGSGKEAVMLAEYKRPDIILLEMALPDRKGIDVIQEITAQNQHSRVLFVTANTDEIYVFEAFKAGAKGYVAEESASVDLIQAIHLVRDGHLFVKPDLTHLLPENR